MPEIDLELSHERVRPALRLDQGAPLPASAPVASDSGPLDRAPHGEIGDSRTAKELQRRSALARSRKAQLEARLKGIATLDPQHVPSWMRPYVDLGATYIRDLVTALEGREVLHHLAGDCADAHTVFRALLSLALDAEPKERTKLLTEARGWLREHRTALATLSALAGNVPKADPSTTPDAVAKADKADEAAMKAKRKKERQALIDAGEDLGDESEASE